MQGVIYFEENLPNEKLEFKKVAEEEAEEAELTAGEVEPTEGAAGLGGDRAQPAQGTRDVSEGERTQVQRNFSRFGRQLRPVQRLNLT